MENIMEGKGVTKLFGRLAAINSVDFEIRTGEILGLIGPNGSGKTTLVNLVTGIHQLSSGTVAFKGNDISNRKPHHVGRMGIARTFQIVKPFSGMSVRENVLVSAFFGKDGMARKKWEVLKKAEEVLQIVGLAAKQHYLVEHITLADRKRIELAKALAMDPELIFLDEVMAGLNQKEIEEVMSLIKMINEQGMTFLVIEHVMKAIMGISDRVMVLHHGEKIAVGTPGEIKVNDQVIAAYLGKRYAKKEGA
jgi:branched-chain amino acid transport system ATP-binding protein